MKRFLKWLGGDGFAFILFGTISFVITDSLLKGVIGVILTVLVSYWILLARERREKKIAEPYEEELRKMFKEYQELRALVSEIVNRRVPGDFYGPYGPQTITLTEKEIADFREAFEDSNYA